MNLVLLDVDTVDVRLAERDAVVKLTMTRSHEVLGVSQPEGDEEQPGLVDVPIV